MCIDVHCKWSHHGCTTLVHNLIDIRGLPISVLISTSLTWLVLCKWSRHGLYCVLHSFIIKRCKWSRRGCTAFLLQIFCRTVSTSLIRWCTTSSMSLEMCFTRISWFVLLLQVSCSELLPTLLRCVCGHVKKCGTPRTCKLCKRLALVDPVHRYGGAEPHPQGA